MLGARLLTSACVAVEKFSGNSAVFERGYFVSKSCSRQFCRSFHGAWASPQACTVQQCKLLEAPRELFGLLCHVCFLGGPCHAIRP